MVVTENLFKTIKYNSMVQKKEDERRGKNKIVSKEPKFNQIIRSF